MLKPFFLTKKWAVWAYGGSATILIATGLGVLIDVRINQWYGTFFDSIQKALNKEQLLDFSGYLHQVLTFLEVAIFAIFLNVILDFITKHFVFRWRKALNEHYIEHWENLRHIEGAAQRVQEDTLRFARLTEVLGVRLMKALLTLGAFLPMLWSLSDNIKEMPWLGTIEHSLVYVAVLYALGGTIALAILGIKLPGLEFENQKVEAAYRKKLVLEEDASERSNANEFSQLFKMIQANNFRLYIKYFYFDTAKWSYLQFGVIVPLVAMGPSVVAGVLTFGTLQMIMNAFGRVESSFQYLVTSWTDIVELISVTKRLHAFDQTIAK